MSATIGGYDVIVVGSGVAGMSTALGLAGHRRVALVTSGALGGGSTRWAQGGIAAAIGADDSPALHAADTRTAGVDVCNVRAVERLTLDAPQRLDELIELGAQFDRSAGGGLDLTREGGHHRRRVAHAGGDSTGAEVSRALAAAVGQSEVELLEHTVVIDVLRVPTGPRQVTGVVVRSEADGEQFLAARAVVLASGGIGGVYASSTNPVDVTGDGIAIALRAGASLVDMEFVQFHPTGLRTGSTTGQIPLVTEALRGEGAVLRDRAGQRIMPGHHPLADLAPRDVVARRIDAVMSERLDGVENAVFLDATGFEPGVMRDRFPTVYAACLRHGIDPVRAAIPVAPTQHFLCGGVRTDSWGQTDVTGLYAVGEVAATGVHGANRLASNSLLEGMVFGRRLAARLSRELPPRTRATGSVRFEAPAIDATALDIIRTTMTESAGVRRSGPDLEVAAKTLESLVCLADGERVNHPSLAAANCWQVAAAIVAAAEAREESRGCHWRDDYPRTRERWRRHVLIRLGEDGTPAAAAVNRLKRTA
jgi:L-aspartate oxidase